MCYKFKCLVMMAVISFICPPGMAAAQNFASTAQEQSSESGDVLAQLENMETMITEQEQQVEQLKTRDIPKDDVAPAAVVEREMSMEEQQAYWQQDVADQSIPDIKKRLRIDAAFREAKEFMKQVDQDLENVPQRVEKDVIYEIKTPEEIIRGVIPEEVAGREIDLDFDETPLEDVLMTLGASAEVNIMLDPSLRGKTLDLHLKSVTVEHALLLIAQPFDLGFKQIGNSLLVTERQKLRNETLESKVFTLRNISADQVEILVRDMVETVNISPDINSLLVMGSPQEIRKVERIIKEVDKPQLQVILEAKIVEVDKGALKQLGVDWSDSISLSYQESGRPNEFDTTEDAPDNPFKIFQLSRSALQFDTVLKMLETQDKAKVLSNPRVATMNDRQAEIFVGDRIPYTVTTVSGGVATTDVRFEEPGIRLQITPSIIDEDFVVIKVEPEVSYIFSFRGDADEYPWTKKRSATAYVRVKNNQPFVMGGLLSQQDKETLYKVPFLGDIPLIGNLFNYDDRTLEDVELIITVVPKIVRGEE
ncbi:MAG: type II secretion system protein GspD [Candidatus Omnitrophota bacterium]